MEIQKKNTNLRGTKTFDEEECVPERNHVVAFGFV